MSFLDLKKTRNNLSKKFAKIVIKRCVACGECVQSCPRGAVSIINGCYAVIDSEMCLGCGRCDNNCPAGCIIILDREQANKNEE